MSAGAAMIASIGVTIIKVCAPCNYFCSTCMWKAIEDPQLYMMEGCVGVHSSTHVYTLLDHVHVFQHAPWLRIARHVMITLLKQVDAAHPCEHQAG